MKMGVPGFNSQTDCSFFSKTMTVAELIAELSKYPADLEVTITDGYEYKFYSGKYEFQEWENTVEIGVGGLDQGYQD